VASSSCGTCFLDHTEDHRFGHVDVGSIEPVWDIAEFGMAHGHFSNGGLQRHRSGFELYHSMENFGTQSIALCRFLILTLGLWYYGVVPDAIEQRKEQQLELLGSMTNDPVAFAQFIASNPALADRTSEEVYTQQAENLNVFFSPVFYLGTVAMAWVFASLIITAIFTWVWERVWIST